MGLKTWSYIFASVIGTSHIKADKPCQDRSNCELLTGKDGTQILVAVTADGAGSAARAEDGAALACSLFYAKVSELLKSGGACAVTREFVVQWLGSFQQEILAKAQGEELTAQDFACTFLAAVVGEDCAVFAQIGDGAIVISPSSADNYSCIFWPQQGEYVNQTNFATDQDAHENLEYQRIDGVIDELAMFTDGLQMLALDYKTRKAFTPFFQPIFEWLRPAQDGSSEKHTSALKEFLAAEKTNERTDDDKTLILATRRSPTSSFVVSEPNHESL